MASWIDQMEQDAKDSRRAAAAIEAQKHAGEQGRLDSYYDRMANAHARRMQSHYDFVQSNPDSHSLQERRAAEAYFRQKYQEGRDAANDDYRNSELETREKVAEYGWMGQRDAGATAAAENALAANYGADRTREGIEAQAKSAIEVARQKAEAEKYIADKQTAAADAASEREWGKMEDGLGGYTPGGRVKAAQAEAEGRIKAEQERNQAKTEQERIKAEAKIKATEIASSEGVKKAAAGNPLLARLMQNEIQKMLEEGKTKEEIMKELNLEEAQGGQDGKSNLTPGQQRTAALVGG